jgi:hypothetical protein
VLLNNNNLVARRGKKYVFSSMQPHPVRTSHMEGTGGLCHYFIDLGQEPEGAGPQAAGDSLL